MVLIDVGDVTRVNGGKKLDEPVSFLMPILGAHVALHGLSLSIEVRAHQRAELNAEGRA